MHQKIKRRIKILFCKHDYESWLCKNVTLELTHKRCAKCGNALKRKIIWKNVGYFLDEGVF